MCEVSCNRDHHSVSGHVGYLVLGVQEGGEGDIPSNLFLSLKLLGPCSLSEPFTSTFLGSEWLFLNVFWCVRSVNVDLLSLSLGSHVEHLVGLGHDGRGATRAVFPAFCCTLQLLRLGPGLWLSRGLLRLGMLLLDRDDDGADVGGLLT